MKREKWIKKDNEITIMVVLLVIVLLAVLLAAIFFVSYNKNEKKQLGENSETNQGNSYYKTTEEEETREKELASILKNNLPIIDGDTSTIALEAGIVAKLTGKTIEEAEAVIVHSTEEKAFNNLLSGQCDLFFTTNLTENQEREAASKNKDLQKEVVANEGLVFVVNSENPVETLTQEQLIDIFSGKITNWKEVGGNDAKIVVYQNAQETKAQYFMEMFMDDVELMNPTTEILPATNSGLIEAIATYDNSENAIGFMVYKYPSSAYGYGDEVKYLKVDGIEATKQTMTEHSYLVTYDIYAVYSASKSSSSKVAELVEWLLTADGQTAISEAGYIPLKNIEVSDITVEKYNSYGTGKEQTEETEIGDFYYTVNSKDYTQIGQGGKAEGITGLQDEELEEKINQFIRESAINLQTKENDYDTYLEQTANSVNEGISLQTECKNGYLSVQVVLSYKIGTISYIYDGYSAIYDLYTGEEVEFSDLYYKDTDFEYIINKQIETLIVERKGIESNDVQMKRPFIGITDNCLYGLETISFKKENPYFVEGEIFNLDTYFEAISILNEERDMQDIWEEDITISKAVVTHEANGKSLQRGKVAYEEIQNCVYYIFYTDTNHEEYDKKVNEYIDKYTDNSKIDKLIQNVKDNNPDANFILNSKEQYQITISVTVLGNKFAIMNITANQKPNEISLGYLATDLETGQTVSKADIQEWQTENGI